MRYVYGGSSPCAPSLVHNSLFSPSQLLPSFTMIHAPALVAVFFALPALAAPKAESSKAWTNAVYNAGANSDGWVYSGHNDTFTVSNFPKPHADALALRLLPLPVPYRLPWMR